MVGLKYKIWVTLSNWWLLYFAKPWAYQSFVIQSIVSLFNTFILNCASQNGQRQDQGCDKKYMIFNFKQKICYT